MDGVGDQIPDQLVEYGGKVKDPGEPTGAPENYNFRFFTYEIYIEEEDYWDLRVWDFDENVVRGDLTLKAEWEISF